MSEQRNLEWDKVNRATFVLGRADKDIGRQAFKLVNNRLTLFSKELKNKISYSTNISSSIFQQGKSSMILQQ